MFGSLRARIGRPTHVVRDGPGDEVDQPVPQPAARLSVEALDVWRLEVTRELTTAVGDHLGQSADLLISQAAEKAVARGRTVLGQRLGWHALLQKEWEARLGFAYSAARYGFPAVAPP